MDGTTTRKVLDFCDWYRVDPARLITISVPGREMTTGFTRGASSKRASTTERPFRKTTKVVSMGTRASFTYAVLLGLYETRLTAFDAKTADSVLEGL